MKSLLHSSPSWFRRRPALAYPKRRRDGQIALVCAAGVSAASFGFFARSAPKVHCDSRPSSKDGVQAESGEDLGTLDVIKSTIGVDAVANWASDWGQSLALFQESASTLWNEINGGEGSLFDQIVNDPPDTALHPELAWDAHVRLGGNEELCFAENAFLRDRRRRMVKAFAYYLDVPESEMDERDLPVISIASSGGGYRAMTSTLGALQGVQSSGLLDCTTYLAGLSGSSWALTSLYGVGHGDVDRTVKHIRDRIVTPFLHPSSLDILTSPPTNKYLLEGVIRKATSPGAELSMTDLYGTLVSTRIFVPKNPYDLDPRDLKLSHHRIHVDNASLPLPIYTCVRHHIPEELESELDDVRREKRNAFISNARRDDLETKAEGIVSAGHYQWFEQTPYEFGCDELGAWIPTWALGRRFDKGSSTCRVPELSLTILVGIYGSAFCSSLFNYIRELQPFISSMPFSDTLQKLISEREKNLQIIHPVAPNEIPSFVRGLEDSQLRQGAPAGMGKKETLGLMDAGAVLNIPYFPLMRRNVDMIVALDNSADSHELWFTRAEELAAKRGLKTWPRGARWPKQVTEAGEAEPLSYPASCLPWIPSAKGSASPPAKSSPEDANRRLAAAQESDVLAQAERQRELTNGDGPEPSISPPPSPASSSPAPYPMSIWIGSSQESEESSEVDPDNIDETELAKRDGIAVVYLPLVANEAAVPDFDPVEAWSTWRFDYKPEETDKLLKLCEENVKFADPKLKRVTKAIWRRKRDARLAKERKDKIAHHSEASL